MSLRIEEKAWLSPEAIHSDDSDSIAQSPSASPSVTSGWISWIAFVNSPGEVAPMQATAWVTHSHLGNETVRTHHQYASKTATIGCEVKNTI